MVEIIYRCHYYVFMDMDISTPTLKADMTKELIGVIAYDIALSGDTKEVVAERNGITIADIAQLEANNTLYNSTVSQLKLMAGQPDDDAGFGMRLRSFAETALPEMGKLMADSTVTPELKVGIFKAYLSYITSRDKIEISNNGGGAVQVNFVMSPQVRGMKEINGINK